MTKTIRFLQLFLLLLWLICSSAWAALTIYFGDSYSSTIQLILSTLVAMIGITVIVSQLLLSTWRKRLLLIHSVIFITVIIYWFNIQAMNDRNWQTDVSILAYANIKSDLVTVHNIRNYKYRSEFDYKTEYYNKTFDLTKLEGVDMFAVYWMGPSIAHIIMSFDFGEQNHLAISIEARKEKDESYSTIKGFFRQYELVYIVSDERDIIGLRTHYRKDPPEQVYRYRLIGPKENTRRLFLEYIDHINILNNTPVFYNTLLANCTSIIWLHNRVNPEHLPFSWKILLSGYLPEYLYESVRLDQKLPFSQLREQAHINPLIEGQQISESFSSAIRP